jgi:hypothetical protein
LEESSDFGGALDAHGNPSTGYFMTGSRMFDERTPARSTSCRRYRLHAIRALR